MIHSCTTTTTTRRYNGYDETLDKTLSYLNTTLPTLCDVVCTFTYYITYCPLFTVEYVICLGPGHLPMSKIHFLDRTFSIFSLKWFNFRIFFSQFLEANIIVFSCQHAKNVF